MNVDFYTWPNPAFPFRLYYDKHNIRVFIIENLFHNYKWLKQVVPKIKPTDYFFVYVGWNISKYIAETNRRVLDDLGLDSKQFFFMFNDYNEMSISSDYGLHGDVINQNAWLDENQLQIQDVEKEYDAVYIARPSAFKRHYLASSVPKLALVAGGNNHGQLDIELPQCVNDPTERLDREGIKEIINKSGCGLCLSQEEGACFASSEYLLCGVPVVATQSSGGGDMWYTLENSIVASDTPECIAAAVHKINSMNLSPQNIRDDHIKKMKIFRDRFIKIFDQVIQERGVTGESGAKYLRENYIDKMRTSQHIEKVLRIFDDV